MILHTDNERYLLCFQSFFPNNDVWIWQSENYDTLLGFNVLTYRSCKNLWKSCVEHHTFFRLHSPQTTRGRHFLSLGSKFSYSGRTQCQALEDTRTSHRSFLRSPTKRVIRQTVSWPMQLCCFFQKVQFSRTRHIRPLRDLAYETGMSVNYVLSIKLAGRDKLRGEKDVKTITLNVVCHDCNLILPATERAERRITCQESCK